MARWHSKAGKKGYKKTKIALRAYNRQAKVTAKSRWESEDKHCPNCDSRVPYTKRENTFCSMSCRTSYTNRNSEARPRKQVNACTRCGQPTKRKASVYCSTYCAQEHRREKTDAEVKKTKQTSGFSVSRTKRVLLRMHGRQCSICTRKTWCGEPIPLVMDHIDGDAENGHTDNLRLVCGNCDMQLPTYKGRNIGNGRAYRRQRYKEGKSY